MPLLGSFALERLKLLAQFGELLGNEESISRIVDQKPSLASRIWQTLKGFVKRIAGVQSSQADRIRQAEAMFRKALETVGIQTTGEMQFTLKDDVEGQFSYDQLISKPDMTVATMPDMQVYKKSAGADRAKAKADGMKNAQSIPGAVTLQGRSFVRNVYTGGLIQINSNAIQHGILGSQGRQLRNAAAGAIIGDLTSNAIPVNELVHTRQSSQPWVKSEHLYVAIAEDSTDFYPVAIVVQTSHEDLGVVTHVEALRGIEKQFVYSVNAGQHAKGAGYKVKTVQHGGTSTSSKISIADLLELVKDDFADGFSSDVLSRLGIARPNGQFAGRTQFSNPVPVLPSPEIRAAQMADYHAKFVSGAFDGGNGNGSGGSFNSETDAPDNGNLGERQFTGKTLQRSMAIPMQFKNELFRNPRG